MFIFYLLAIKYAFARDKIAVGRGLGEQGLVAEMLRLINSNYFDNSLIPMKIVEVAVVGETRVEVGSYPGAVRVVEEVVAVEVQVEVVVVGAIEVDSQLVVPVVVVVGEAQVEVGA